MRTTDENYSHSKKLQHFDNVQTLRHFLLHSLKHAHWILWRYWILYIGYCGYCEYWILWTLCTLDIVNIESRFSGRLCWCGLGAAVVCPYLIFHFHHFWAPPHHLKRAPKSAYICNKMAKNNWPKYAKILRSWKKDTTADTGGGGGKYI